MLLAFCKQVKHLAINNKKHGMVRRVESQTPQKKEEKMSCDGKDKLMIKT